MNKITLQEDKILSENIISREFMRRGYDIIENQFFVEEHMVYMDNAQQIKDTRTITFECFESYFEYLGGDIYLNACYYGYTLKQEDIKKFSIKLNKINYVSLINDAINNYTLEFSEQELKEYKKIETQKKQFLKWVDKLNECKDYNQFEKIINQYKSFFCQMNYSENHRNLLVLLYGFIYNNTQKAFDIIMQYVRKNYDKDLELGLCIIYNPQQILANYDKISTKKSTIFTHKKRLRQFITCLNDGNVLYRYKSYFDKKTHLYLYEITIGFDNDGATIIRSFNKFDEFAAFLNNDLTNCDLSGAIIKNIDFTKYKIDKTTILPIGYQKNFSYEIMKKYDRRDKSFIVGQRWLDENGNMVKSYIHRFDYFFDFLYFLKNDLSDANLLFCDGLINISDFSKINLKNARLQSIILDRIGVKYDSVKIDIPSLEYYDEIVQNEENTSSSLMEQREMLLDENEDIYKFFKIYYVTDIHLMHRLKNAQCKSENDIHYCMQKIIDNILKGAYMYDVILIGGDVSSDFIYYCKFVSMLRKSLMTSRRKIKIIFTLGNHELWQFAGKTVEEIVEVYRNILTEHGMYLLQNNILYFDDSNEIQCIDTKELSIISADKLKEKIKRARVILFGGIGFSGCEEKYNAFNSIYRYTITREQEIEQSKIIEDLYTKVCSILGDRRIIIFTHMPLNNWCKDGQPHSGYVYVSGHTHRNYFYDDGEYRIYSDNQIGYRNVSVNMKFFLLNGEYDIFNDYADGIYNITLEEYIEFYRGINMLMTFNRKNLKIFLLKKKGYYCFISQSISRNLSIMNGGSLNKLAYRDIKYYYENMDAAIKKIKMPLSEYTVIQEQISDAIKQIGGSGIIHGAIVDIDEFNHVYVNPNDLKITPYWALDIVKKVVYPNVEKLLEDRSPEIYVQYMKQSEENPLALTILSNLPEVLNDGPLIYLDTDIYKASRIIKKMQRLENKILSVWVDPNTGSGSTTNGMIGYDE